MKNFFFKVLRFFNLLEPGSRVLSISKIFMWTTIITVFYTMIFHSDNLAAVIGTSATALISTGNYGLRRIEQRKSNGG